uniref:FLYWCH-type domain-containing protein n=1 Tax=Glossina brevipalpis TaxID=37001 RepID=A0A1A9WMM7_9MUSC
MQHVRDCGPQLFIISRKGGTLLAINDFIYRSNLRRFGPLGDKVYWECIHNRSKKCRSRLKTIGDDLYVTNDVHNHVGDRQRIELARRSDHTALWSLQPSIVDWEKVTQYCTTDFK